MAVNIKMDMDDSFTRMAVGFGMDASFTQWMKKPVISDAMRILSKDILEKQIDD